MCLGSLKILSLIEWLNRESDRGFCSLFSRLRDLCLTHRPLAWSIRSFDCRVPYKLKLWHSSGVQDTISACSYHGTAWEKVLYHMSFAMGALSGPLQGLYRSHFSFLWSVPTLQPWKRGRRSEWNPTISLRTDNEVLGFTQTSEISSKTRVPYVIQSLFENSRCDLKNVV